MTLGIPLSSVYQVNQYGWWKIHFLVGKVKIRNHTFSPGSRAVPSLTHKRLPCERELAWGTLTSLPTAWAGVQVWGKFATSSAKFKPQMSLLLLLLSSALAVFTHSCTSTLLNCDVFFPWDLFVRAAVVFRGSCYNCICNHTDRFRGICWINMVLLNTRVQILVFAHWSKDWLCHSNFRACLPILSLGIAWFPFICSALSFCVCCSWSQAARLCIKYVACRNNKCQ